MLASSWAGGVGVPGYKFDHPPLLAPGRHFMTIVELRRLCVDPFTGPALSRRKMLYYGLEQLHQSLLVAKIPCQIIVDGSFLTAKPEPGDIDVKVYIENDCHETLSDDQLILFNEINDDGNIPNLDSTAWVIYARGHECFGTALDPRNQGEDYGLEHGEVWLKGYAVLRLWETNVGLRIHR
jgi:hypothetical protein